MNVKKVYGFFGIVYLYIIHTICRKKFIIVLPDGIGEIVNSAPYWDSSSGEKCIMLLYNKKRKNVLKLINCDGCICKEIPDWLNKANKCIIYSSFGKRFLKKNKDWIVIPLKDPKDIQFEKGFIWNIKDAMHTSLCNNWRLEKKDNKYSKDNKIIYINPFARTVPELSNDFFELLSKKLTDKGYVVKTILGNEDQLPIIGTEGVKCELDEAVEIIASGKGLIGLRSGFMDMMVCKVQMNIVCLYPQDYPYIDFFSFKNLEYYNNVQEMNIGDENSYKQLIEEIIKVME